MTAKSIDWEHLSRQGHYCAHDMAHFLYPEDSARKTFNRGKFLLRSLLYRAQLNRVFELFQSAPLRALPARHPELLDKPMRPYRFACSTVNQRVKMVEDHYRLLLGLYPELIDPLYLGEGIVLGHYPDGGWRIVLRHDGTFRREAELALAGAMGAHRVCAVRMKAHIFQARRYSKKKKACLQADYDELWQEFGALDQDANFVRLQPVVRKPLEEIASKKRAMYRRRYEWLDGLERAIRQQFARS